MLVLAVSKSWRSPCCWARPKVPAPAPKASRRLKAKVVVGTATSCFVTAVTACGRTNLELPSLLLRWVVAFTNFLDLVLFDVKDFVDVVDFFDFTDFVDFFVDFFAVVDDTFLDATALADVFELDVE